MKNGGGILMLVRIRKNEVWGKYSWDEDNCFWVILVEERSWKLFLLWEGEMGNEFGKG